MKIDLRLFDSKSIPKVENEAKAENTEKDQGVDMSAIEEKINSILALAQKKAEEIISGAQEQAGKLVDSAATEAEKMISKATEKLKAAAPRVETKEEKDERKKFMKAYMNEKVPVFLFKDNNKYKDDVIIGHNGEFCQIQRGKRVMVKRKFARILENSSVQDASTANLMDQLAAQLADREAEIFSRK